MVCMYIFVIEKTNELSNTFFLLRFLIIFSILVHCARSALKMWASTTHIVPYAMYSPILKLPLQIITQHIRWYDKKSYLGKQIFRTFLNRFAWKSKLEEKQNNDLFFIFFWKKYWPIEYRAKSSLHRLNRWPG